MVLFVLASCITMLCGQEDAAIDSAITNNITRQLSVFPHEKIYLHTDKPYYITGEKIFFRAFLLDAFTNRQIARSRYVYIELVNPADSVVQRLRIRPDENNLFHGAIPLPEELPQGGYRIRAYTQYMQNQGESLFFSKQVRISDPQTLSVKTETNFKFIENGRIDVNMHFVDVKTNEIVKPELIHLRLNQDRQFTSKANNEGFVNFRLIIPSKAKNRALYIETTINNRIYKQYIQIPYPEGDFDVSFYPEGGRLIDGQASNVAFKAVDTHGTPLNVTGEITNSKGEMVATFKTVHDGMGDFFISPKSDEQYQAVCYNGSRTILFDLPAAQLDAFALKTTIKENNLLVAVNKQVSTSLPELYLLIHSGGLVTYAKAWDDSRDFVSFDKSAFPSGINHIVLLTKDLQIVSERLVFLLNEDQGLAEFHTQKEIYREREQIQAGIQLTDAEGRPLKGNFSIAVTNDKEVITDTTSGIFSGILLRSELRGSIEHPEYYFQKGNKEAEIAADLLMKTHGWTRYHIPDVINGNLIYPTIPFEASQEISGTVKGGLLSQPAKNFKVTLVSMGTEFFFDQTETDENGRYVFGNFEFPDSTKFVIQALNSKDKGKPMTDLYIDEETFPGIHETWNESFVQEEKNNSVLLDYISKADLHYTCENGMRVIHLPEVEIKSTYRDNVKYKSNLYLMPSYSISEDAIIKNGSGDIKGVFYGIPGVMVGGDIRIKGSPCGGRPLVLIDDLPIEIDGDESVLEFLNTINVLTIGQIDIVSGTSMAGMFGYRGCSGAIAIYTKRLEDMPSRPSFNVKEVMPLGYQTPVEFYSPKYDTQESINNPTPDFRTTIYWKPNVITDDEGNGKLEFYSADDPATYSVIIEGVSDDGRLIHYLGNAVIMVHP